MQTRLAPDAPLSEDRRAVRAVDPTGCLRDRQRPPASGGRAQGVEPERNRASPPWPRRPRRRRRTPCDAETGIRARSRGKSSPPPAGSSPRSGRNSAARSLGRCRRLPRIPADRYRSVAAAASDPGFPTCRPRRTAPRGWPRLSACPVFGPGVKAPSTSWLACRLDEDRAKNTSRYPSGLASGLPAAPMTSGAQPCMPAAPRGAEDARISLRTRAGRISGSDRSTRSRDTVLPQALAHRRGFLRDGIETAVRAATMAHLLRQCPAA